MYNMDTQHEFEDKGIVVDENAEDKEALEKKANDEVGQAWLQGDTFLLPF